MAESWAVWRFGVSLFDRSPRTMADGFCGTAWLESPCEMLALRFELARSPLLTFEFVPFGVSEKNLDGRRQYQYFGVIGKPLAVKGDF